jgi:UDP-glucose 4-epimerase
MTLNLSTRTQTSIRELAMLIGSHYDVTVKFGKQLQGDIQHSELSNLDAMLSLKWKPRYDLKTGIQDTIYEIEKVIEQERE